MDNYLENANTLGRKENNPGLRKIKYVNRRQPAPSETHGNSNKQPKPQDKNEKNITSRTSAEKTLSPGDYDEHPAPPTWHTSRK